MILLAEVGLMWGVGERDGLCMVRVRNSKDFLLRRKFRSLANKLVGESNGELVRVTLVLGPLFQLVKMEGDNDGTYVDWVVEGKSWNGDGAEKGGKAFGLGWIFPGEGF